MTDRYEKNLKALSHEIWAAAQLAPGEGIVDGVARVEAMLRAEAEYEYEVWQGDALQAGGSTTDYASAQSEANHYAMMYAPDGPVEVRIYEKRLLSAVHAAQAPRACTCHPDDRPDGHCRERYAASECLALAAQAQAAMEQGGGKVVAWRVPVVQSPFGEWLDHGVRDELVLVMHRGTHGWKAAGQGHALLAHQVYVKNVEPLCATSHEVAVVGLSGGGWRTVWARSDDDVTHPAPPSAPVGVPSAKTLASVVWSDWMTNEQADRLGDALHKWLTAYFAQQPAGDTEAEALAKYQPCGCVICTCEDEKQCHGCGAKHCGNRTDHPPYVKQQPAEQHPDDAAVDRFAVAMKAKLNKKRQEGRGGWQSMTAEQLSALLHEHVRKGDPVDVANLAMMLHQNGQVIEPPAPVVTDEIDAIVSKYFQLPGNVSGAYAVITEVLWTERMRRMAEDAARYRWLRDREIPELLDLWLETPDRIDAAIDEAMKKEVSND